MDDYVLLLQPGTSATIPSSIGRMRGMPGSVRASLMSPNQNTAMVTNKQGISGGTNTAPHRYCSKNNSLCQVASVDRRFRENFGLNETVTIVVIPVLPICSTSWTSDGQKFVRPIFCPKAPLHFFYTQVSDAQDEQ